VGVEAAQAGELRGEEQNERRIAEQIAAP